MLSHAVRKSCSDAQPEALSVATHGGTSISCAAPSYAVLCRDR